MDAPARAIDPPGRRHAGPRHAGPRHDGVARAVRGWRRHVALGLAVGGLADGVGAVASAGVVAVLVARLFGVVVAPDGLARTAVWACAIVVPLAVAIVRVRRRLPSAATAAAHLDRRLHLAGLLLTGAERDASAWGDRLDAGLVGAGHAAPRVRWGRAAARALVPGLALWGVVLLPEPSPSRAPADVAVAEALARFERRFEEIVRHDGVREEVREEVARRVDALERRREDGGEVRWSDVDALAERTEREVAMRATELAQAAASLGAFARSTPTDGAQAQAAMTALLDATTTLDLVEDVPADVAAAAGLDGAAGTTAGPDGLAADAQALAALAQAMAATAGSKLDALAELGALSAADRDALARLMEGDPVARRLREGVCEACDGTGECDGTCAACGGSGCRGGAAGAGGEPGRGGISRGRADATLNLTGSTAAGTEGSRPERLPPGAPVPAPSVRIGLGRGVPEVAPVRDGGAGSAGDTGVGAAAWRRRIAPRHRDAVRAFFAGADTPAATSRPAPPDAAKPEPVKPGPVPPGPVKPEPGAPGK